MENEYMVERKEIHRFLGSMCITHDQLFGRTCVPAKFLQRNNNNYPHVALSLWPAEHSERLKLSWLLRQ